MPRHEPEPFLIGSANPALKGLSSAVLKITIQSSREFQRDEKDISENLEDRLREAITSRLSAAGISPFMPNFGTLVPADAPVLTVAVDILKHKNWKQYVVRIQTSLSADVCLKSDSSMCLKAELWTITTPMQVVSKRDIFKRIMTEAVSHTEAFTTEHMVANQATAAASKPAEPEKKPDAAEYKYVASKNSRVFHNPECTLAKRISPKNLIGFATRADAVNSKRRPCKRCKP